jgi:uncharacterized protein YcbK (DUF882 family)
LTIRYSIFAFILLGFFLVGCDGFTNLFKEKRTIAKDDILLASVEGRDMYLSEVKEMLSAKTQSDSLSQLNYFIESWIKRNVVLTEAEINFPENIDIYKLVEDYKSSLLLHNYRQILIEKELDTTVTLEQEKEYYEANKEQYRLQNRICRGRIASVSEKASKMEKFYRNWKKNDSLAIDSYLEEYAASRMDDDTSWFTVDEFLSFLPHDSFKSSDFYKTRNLQKNYEKHEYFVKITDVLDQNETAPFFYVKESIRKLIIHKRKKQILDNIEQNLYKKYLKSNRIKVYTTG